jgi:membrane-bound lytic murein transglycosylase D
MTGDDLFFALSDKNYLKAETRDYVPQLIAAALVGKEPQRYGLTIVPRPVFAYDSARVGPYTPLTAVARATGATVADIRDLNPQLLRGMSPPKDSVTVRIPAGTGQAFDSVFAGIEPEAQVGAHSIITKVDETMSGIAKRSGITTAQLNAYNPSAKRLKSGNLVAGQSILVPTPPTAAAAVVVPDPSIERFGAVTAGVSSHVVLKGENLNAIAKKYGTTAAAIMQVNGLRTALIIPGQVLALPPRKK